MDAPAMVSGTSTKSISEWHARFPFSNMVLLGLWFLLVSCSQNDRISTVTCDGDPEGPIAVTTELLFHGKRTSITGYLNSWDLSPGSIVRINSGAARSEAIVEWQRLPLTKPDLLLSRKALRSVTLQGGFGVHLDEGLRTMSQRTGIDLSGVILQHTLLYVEDPEVRWLPDIAGLLSRFPATVERIRNSPDISLAIVSGSIDSNGLGIFDAYQTVGINTFELGNSYVHVSYTCHLIKQIAHRANGAPSPVPVIIYLTPIRYDGAIEQVAFQPTPLDLFHGRNN